LELPEGVFEHLLRYLPGTEDVEGVELRRALRNMRRI
jgi:hypothetical protein